MDQLEESFGIAGADAIEPLEILLAHLKHHSLVGLHRFRVSVAAADMGHVHTQHPDEIGTARGNLAESFEEALRRVLAFGSFPARQALDERPTENGEKSNRPLHPVLEKENLELDGVLPRVAEVLLHDRIARAGDEDIVQLGVDFRKT